MHGFHYEICMEYTCMYVQLSIRVSMGVGGGVPPPAQSEKQKGVENEQNLIFYGSF